MIAYRETECGTHVRLLWGVRHAPLHESLGHQFHNSASDRVNIGGVASGTQVVDSPYDQAQDTVAFTPSSEHRKVADETPDPCTCIIIPYVSGRFTVSFATVPLEEP